MVSPGGPRNDRQGDGRPLKTSDTSAAGGTGSGRYRYYVSDEYAIAPSESSRDAARDLSAARLNPSRDNPDYLLLLQRRRHFEAWLGELPDRNLKILDVGGRIQPFRKLLRPRCSAYIAVDPQLEGLTDVVAVGGSLPFADDTFDACVCMQVLSYVREPGRLIDEIQRILKPAGGVFLSAPAFFPEHHDEYWRFLPDAYRILFEDWEALRVCPEGTSSIGAIRTINLILLRGNNRFLHAIAAKILVPLLNRIGEMVLARTPPMTRGFMTVNFCVCARKRGGRGHPDSEVE